MTADDAPRVALFTDTFDEVSGVGHTFSRLADWCAARAWPLTVFTVTPGPSRVETRGSVTIHRVQPRIPLSYYPGLFFDLIPLDDTALTAARQTEFDLVHVATPGHMGITGLYLASRCALPVIGSYHTDLPQYVAARLLSKLREEADDDPDALEYVESLGSSLTWDFLAGFYNHCARVLVPSEATRAQVAPRLRPPLELFARGVDTALFTPARRRRPADAPPRLLYVGRLAVEKNLDWLVAVGQRHPEFELTIVGDGPLRAELAAALPHADLPGFLAGEELAQAYADADLFAFPSLTETFGNVVLEAQASGLPAVVGHLGGPTEIITPGVTGLVADNAESFERHLLALAADPARRATMAAAARQQALGRGWDEVFERLFTQYASARYPWRRRVWSRWLRRWKDSDHPCAVGLVAFWQQFGRRRAARARRQGPS